MVLWIKIMKNLEQQAWQNLQSKPLNDKRSMRFTLKWFIKYPSIRLKVDSELDFMV